MEGLITAVLKISAAVAIGLPLLVYLAQDALIFYRQPVPESRRVEVARRFPAVQEVFIQASDGTRLHAWHAKAPGAASLVLYFGGNAEEVSWMLEGLGETPGVSWLLVDYRGYGLSEGRPSEEGLYRDASAALAYLRRHPRVRPEGIVFFGQSLGSAVAVELATRETPRGLILEAPFTSVRAMGKAVFPFLPISLLVGNQFDSLGRISRVRAPLLILHGDRDEVVQIGRAHV